jgi:hypothetical protein
MRASPDGRASTPLPTHALMRLNVAEAIVDDDDDGGSSADTTDTACNMVVEAGAAALRD